MQLQVGSSNTRGAGAQPAMARSKVLYWYYSRLIRLTLQRLENTKNANFTAPSVIEVVLLWTLIGIHGVDITLISMAQRTER